MNERVFQKESRGNIFIGEFIFRVKPKIKGYGGGLGLKNPLKTSSARTDFFFN